MLIGELATLVGMSKDGIRHYEQLGLISSTPMHAGSRTYRDYDGRAVTRIGQARQAQKLGLSLKEIGAILDAYDTGPATEAGTVAFLEERLVVVQAKIAALREVEAFIEKKLRLHGACTVQARSSKLT